VREEVEEILDSELTDSLINAPKSAQRQVARAVSSHAIDAFGLDKMPVVREVLLSAKPSTKMRKALGALQTQLQEEYHDAQADLEWGFGDEDVVLRIGAKLEALTSLITANQRKPSQAAQEAIIHAHSALDEVEIYPELVIQDLVEQALSFATIVGDL
jgi:hypothetical protein